MTVLMRVTRQEDTGPAVEVAAMSNGKAVNKQVLTHAGENVEFVVHAGQSIVARELEGAVVEEEACCGSEDCGDCNEAETTLVSGSFQASEEDEA